jgi:co-chaperonin GroES (HSP10)
MIIPLGTRVLIKPFKEEKKSTILLVEEKAPTQYEVVAIGDDVTKLSVGNLVFIDPYTYSKVEYKDEILLIIEEAKVLAKFLK